MRLMGRLTCYAALAAVTAAVASAQTDPYGYFRDACYKSSTTAINVHVNATATGVVRYTPYDVFGNRNEISRSDFALLVPPSGAENLPTWTSNWPNEAGATWPEGPQFAAALQAKGLFPTDVQVVSARWARSSFARRDWMWFTLSNGSMIEFKSDDCNLGMWTNCGYSGNIKHCYQDEGLETCCGYLSGSPECIPKNSGKWCCYNGREEYASCNAGDTCCTQMNRAHCCNASSTCCRSTDRYGSTCCATGTTCCTSSYSSQTLCCTASETCNANGYCVPQPTTSTAPSPVPTTPQDPNAPRRACLASGTTYYDITTGPSGTTLQRWSNGQLVDSNWYARLNPPTAGTTTWDEGVAYAATMQTRNVWVYTGPTQAATWEVVAGEDIWRFSTTINGAATQVVFRTSSCV